MNEFFDSPKGVAHIDLKSMLYKSQIALPVNSSGL